jgi:multidrug efflux pump subunit AcrA (membrane-fusion protein)
MAISSLSSSSNTLYSAFQLKQANAIADQKAQQADSLRQSYEVAKQQADAAKQQEQKRQSEYQSAAETATSSQNYAQDLKAKQGQTTGQSKPPEDLFALYQSAKPTLTPYDITQRIVKGSLVNTKA